MKETHVIQCKRCTKKTKVSLRYTRLCNRCREKENKELLGCYSESDYSINYLRKRK